MNRSLLLPAIVLLLCLAGGAALLWRAPLDTPAPAVAIATIGEQLRFPICGAGKRVTCVVDGDTIWLKGEKIRLEAFDTQEMGKPRCAGPGPLAIAARARLAELLNGSTFAIARHGSDVYGRTLATITIRGRDVGDVLIAEGLARPYVPGEAAWCG